MLIILIVMTALFMMLGVFMKEEKQVQLIMLGLAIFLGIGGTYLSYHEGEPFYAYIPLVFTITSLIYSIYVIYTILSNKKDWGQEVDEGMKVSDFD